LRKREGEREEREREKRRKKELRGRYFESDSLRLVEREEEQEKDGILTSERGTWFL